MRCIAYCIAESLHLNSIADYFKKQNYYIEFFRDVLYVTHKNSPAEMFFFRIGCFVTWALTAREERKLALQLKQFSINLLDVQEIDYFIFRYGNKTSLQSHRRNVDIITLEEEEVPIKLAISYGLAQSVKLEAFEESVQKTIRINDSLPRELATKGSISLSGKDISKRMGEIFLERSFVNLNSEYLDMPEYFWQFPGLENYYLMTEKFLDISRRVNSLNQRLDILHGLLDMLNSQLQHRHASLLETIIIILIVLEIILTFIKFHL
jgi:uncharacterized Rmd1/YagE family protein